MATSYAELTRKLTWQRGLPAKGRSLSLFIDVNNQCNLKCRMCAFSDPRVADLPRREMTPVLFDSIARQLFPIAGYVAFGLFTEPFMTRGFSDWLPRVGEHAVTFCDVTTNGTLLTERTIARVLDAGIARLTFSIDGGTKETYESIRVGARFETVVGNARAFLAMRRGGTPRLRFNHVITSRNIDRFDDFLDLVEDIRPDEIDIRVVERMTVVEDRIDFAKMRAIRAKTGAFCERTGVVDAGFVRDRDALIELFDARGARLTCKRPWDTLAIHANGDVQPCMAWSRPPLGNLARQSFDEIWNGAPLLALRDEFDAKQPGVDCRHCTISKDRNDVFDDFYVRMLAKA